MKKLIMPILALCVSAAIAADTVETTTTKTITANGTIHGYAPGKTFIVKETSGPVTYSYDGDHRVINRIEVDDE